MNTLRRTTVHQRRAFVESLGYTSFAYTGKISTAPRQIKHLMRDLEPGHYIVNLEEARVLGPVDVESTAPPERVVEQGFYWLLNYLLRQQFVGLVYMDGYEPKTDLEGVDIDVAFWGVSRQDSMWYMYSVNSRQVYGPYNNYEEALEDVAIKYRLISNLPVVVPVADLHYTAGDKAITRADHWGTAYNIYLDGQAPRLLATVLHAGNDDGLGNPEHDALLIASAGDMFQFITDLASQPQLDGLTVAREAGNMIRQIVNREVY